MMDRDVFGGMLVVVGILFIIGLLVSVFSDISAHREYVGCRTASAQAKSDSIAVALRPECKRWLFPETK